ncbi:MAG TPA: hypothetical protein VGD46_08405 [Rhizobacter sp.]
MKAVFGVVSLLVVLAVVALMASRAAKSPVPAPGAASAPEATARQQAVQIHEQVRQDMNKALEESTRRIEDADK